MDREKLVEAVKNGYIEWRKHALERMLQREIYRSEVKEALIAGEIIEVYEDDKPFGSALFFYIKSKPLHVVASFDEKKSVVYIVTAYRPNKDSFEDDFKTRKKDAKQ